VEVVIAVGIVAFAFVAILGLLPAGLTQFRQAIDTSVCAQISQRVIMDAQQSDFDVLTDKLKVPQSAGSPMEFYTFQGPKVDAPAFRYFDEQGNEVVFTVPNPSATDLAKKNVLYHVNTRITVTTNVPAKGYVGSNSDLATITVEVAFNPSNQPLTVDTGGNSNVANIRRNLLILKPGMPVLTYAAQVGRNQ
jgi:uncharacterized protein (TIGR02598 family)